MALSTNLPKPLSLTKLLAYTVWRNAIPFIGFTDRPAPCQTDMRCKDTTIILIVKWFLKKCLSILRFTSVEMTALI